MSLTMQVEPWSPTWQELEPYWKTHWAEVAMDQDTIPLDLDLEAYATLEQQGKLHLVTLRDFGLVVGYFLGICGSHLHYRTTLHCHTDVYYLSLPYRRGFTASRFFRFVEETLRERGVKKWMLGTKVYTPRLDMTKLFERLGHRKTEQLLTKLL